jgi:hypothetical protein
MDGHTASRTSPANASDANLSTAARRGEGESSNLLAALDWSRDLLISMSGAPSTPPVGSRASSPRTSHRVDRESRTRTTHSDFFLPGAPRHRLSPTPATLGA